MICQGSAHTMKGSSGSKGTKAVLPVAVDDIKKPHPGHIGTFFKPLHTKNKAGRRRRYKCHECDHVGYSKFPCGKCEVPRPAGVLLTHTYSKAGACTNNTNDASPNSATVWCCRGTVSYGCCIVRALYGAIIRALHGAIILAL